MANRPFHGTNVLFNIYCFAVFSSKFNWPSYCQGVPRPVWCTRQDDQETAQASHELRGEQCTKKDSNYRLSQGVWLRWRFCGGGERISCFCKYQILQTGVTRTPMATKAARSLLKIYFAFATESLRPFIQRATFCFHSGTHSSVGNFFTHRASIKTLSVLWICSK